MWRLWRVCPCSVVQRWFADIWQNMQHFWVSLQRRTSKSVMCRPVNYACVRACARACVRACVRACGPACGPACVRACVRASARPRVVVCECVYAGVRVYNHVLKRLCGSARAHAGVRARVRVCSCACIALCLRNHGLVILITYYIFAMFNCCFPRYSLFTCFI